MEARKVFWKRTYLIEKTPQWSITGYSRSAFRTGFYVNGLNIMLDAGPQCFKKPDHIFVTHPHADHIANLPLTLIGSSEETHKYNINCPKEASDKLKKYIVSMFEANALCDDLPVDDWFTIHPLACDDEPLELTCNKSKIKIEIIKCDHGIPTLSYGFGLIKNKLNPIYQGKSGKELRELRKSGVNITTKVIEKKFCFVCDTSIEVFKMNPCILDYSTVFIECTFIKDGEEATAVAKKHVHWKQLKPYVLDNPDVRFVLFHFSLKYKDQEIKDIMDVEFKKDGITNVDLWLVDID